MGKKDANETIEKLFKLLAGGNVKLRSMTVMETEEDSENESAENNAGEGWKKYLPNFKSQAEAEAAAKKLISLKPGDAVRFYNPSTKRMESGWLESIQRDKDGFADAYVFYLDDDVLKCATPPLHALFVD